MTAVAVGSSLRTEVVEVSPDLAEEVLSKNVRNRNLKPGRVKEYAGAMLRGEWTENGESIKLATDGILLDGQHRLAAIVESGVTLPLLVVRGLDASAQETMDIGRKRSLADMLTLRGETNTRVLAAALRHLTEFRKSGRPFAGGNMNLTTQEMLATLEASPAIRGSIQVVRQSATQLRISHGLAAAVHFKMAEVDSEDAGAYFERLGSGAELEEGNALLTLRRLFERQMTAGRSVRQARATWVAAVMIKAFNAWRNGQNIALLSFKSGGVHAERFPEIEE